MGWLSDAWNSVTGAVSSAVNAVVDTVSSAVNTVREGLHQAREYIRREYPTLDRVVSFVETANEVLNPINRVIEAGGILYDGARYAWGRYVTGNPNPEALASMQGRIEHMMIRDGAAARGVATGVAGIFGETAENWVRDRVTPSEESIAAFRRATGINLTPDTAEEIRLESDAESVGYVGGFVGTMVIPGSVAVRGVSMSLRGASMVSRVARFERVAETSLALSTRVNALNSTAFLGRIAPNATGWVARGARGTAGLGIELGLTEVDSAIGDTILGPYTPSASGARPPRLTPQFTNATGAPIDWTSPAAYTSTALTSPTNAFATYTGNGGFTFASAATPVAPSGQSQTDIAVRQIFTDSVQNNGGYLSNEAIADINTRVRSVINPATLSNTNRTEYTQDVIRLRQDLEQNPPTYGDVRVVELQAALYALGQDIKIDGLMGTQTQTAVNNFITNAETMFRQSGIRSANAAPLPRSSIDLVVV